MARRPAVAARQAPGSGGAPSAGQGATAAPGARCGGHPPGRPPRDRARECLRGRLLSDAEVTETPGQGSDQPSPALLMGLAGRPPGAGLAPSLRNGRTSTFRLQLLDPSAASLSATSRSGASMIHKPPRYSFDSTKGPSVTTAPAPRLSMTVALPGTPRPPPKTQWPSATRPSLSTPRAL